MMADDVVTTQQDVLDSIDRLSSTVLKIKRDRDELLAALEALVKAVEDASFDRYAGAALAPAYAVARETIARATEGT
jgi:hypothetical protein